MTARGWLAWSLGCTLGAVLLLGVQGASATTDVVGLSLAGAACLWAGTRAPSSRLSTRWVIALAVVLRLAALPIAPSLSDDGYRYLWDGTVWAELGDSPYAYPPSSHPEVDRDLYQRMNSPEFVSVYPPLSQAVFSAAATAMPGSPAGMWVLLKALLVFGELVGLIALSRMVRPEALALYAWHPLSVIEGAGQGHTEILLVGALGALLAVWHRRPRWTAAALLAGAAVKTWPLALAPLVVRRSGWRALWLATGVAVVLSLPWCIGADGPSVLQSYRLYVGVFDFYSAPYLILKGAIWGVAGEAAGAWAARVLGAVWLSLLAWLWLGTPSSRPPRSMLVMAIVGYGILSPVQHPWHWLPVLAMLPLLQFRRPLFALVTLSTGTYLTYAGSPAAYHAALWAGWGGALGLLLIQGRTPILQWILRRRARSKWTVLRSAGVPLTAGSRLLDLGCGEGHVGERASVDTGVAVTLADVVDLSTSPRPRCIVRPGSLPFQANRFDAVLLSYVLHHAERPVAVLSEAVRVSKGPVVVLETVASTAWYLPLLQMFDQTVNRVRGGAHMDPFPPRIRPVGEWHRLAAHAGLTLRVVRTWGTVHPQALFVVTAASTSSTDASA